jgi:hypothetical protein
MKLQRLFKSFNALQKCLFGIQNACNIYKKLGDGFENIKDISD